MQRAGSQGHGRTGSGQGPEFPPTSEHLRFLNRVKSLVLEAASVHSGATWQSLQGAALPRMVTRLVIPSSESFLQSEQGEMGGQPKGHGRR